jgi:LysW-gamma-L-lysine carboxypeptidase
MADMTKGNQIGADVALLEAMLRIRSLSREESALAHMLREQMARRGFDARIDEVGNVVGVRGDPRSGPTVALLGHLDTVPGEVPVRRAGDLLYGRGAVDAKGPLAAFIAAASAHEGPGCVMVIGAVEEEAATSRGARHIMERVTPDFAVIGEPSNWDRLTVGYKGRLLAHYRLERTMAHSAGARASACEVAVSFWQRVQQAVEFENAARPGAAFDRLQPSLRAMRSESDGLMESAELELGFRLPPGFEVERWQQELCKLANDAVVRCFSHEQAVRVEKNTPLARAMLAAIRAQGGEPRFVVKTGTSDLNVVASRWRCPMLAYGPGDSALDHTPDEHISIAEYLRAVGVLRGMLTALCGGSVEAGIE